MSLIDTFFYPKNFLGLTDLKTGTLIVAIIDLIMSIFCGFGSSLMLGGSITLIGIVCTILCIIGIKKNKPGFIKAYYIYLFVCLIGGLFLLILSCVSTIFTLNPLLFVFVLVYFIVVLYSFSVVKAYHHHMVDIAKDVNGAAAAV